MGRELENRIRRGKICQPDNPWILYFSSGTQRRFVIGTSSTVWNAVHYPSTRVRLYLAAAGRGARTM